MPADSPELPSGSDDSGEGDWNHLIARAQAGEQDELGQLLETCRNYLLLVASSELPPELRAKGGASDLVQETFLVAQQQFPRFKGASEREFLAWLKGILKHTSAHFRRGYQGTLRRGVNREVALEGAGQDRGEVLEDDATPPSGVASRRELTEVLELALQRITPRERDLLLWAKRKSSPSMRWESAWGSPTWRRKGLVQGR